MLLDRLKYMVQMQLKRMHEDKVVLVTRGKGFGFGFGLETCQGKKPDGALIGEGKKACVMSSRVQNTSNTIGKWRGKREGTFVADST